MGTTGVPDKKPSSRFSLSRHTALILAPFVWLVGVPFAHGVIPWAISFLTPRYGWTGNRPGIVNLLGVVPIIAGVACLIWVFVLGCTYFADIPDRIELNWKPKLLMRRGPYAFSRNPMYVAELALWFGWAIFFGSVAVLIGSIILCAAIRLVVAREERDLKSQFDSDYREYMAAVPRWFGRAWR